MTLRQHVPSRVSIKAPDWTRPPPSSDANPSTSKTRHCLFAHLGLLQIHNVPEYIVGSSCHSSTTTLPGFFYDMFSVATMPIFSDPSWGHYRPAEPSPLTSSPIRASSPLSPLDRNSVPQRTCFSSPPGPPSKFSARTTKPNPLLRKREDNQQTRRQLFMKNVRDRAEDKAWERRSIEGNVCPSLRLAPSHAIMTLLTCLIRKAVRTWYEEQRELARQKELDTMGVLSEADIEDAAAMAEASSQQDYDAMLVDDVAQREEAELEALLAMEQETQPTSAVDARTNSAQRPPSGCYLADDDEYEEIFMQLIQNESRDGDAMDTC